MNIFSETQQQLDSPNANAAGKLQSLVLRLLTAQYKATGATKPDRVLASIGDRITALGGEVPICCVWKKQTLASIELIQATIDIVPYLNSFCRPGSLMDGRYVTPVACAIADAFKMACSKKLIGVDLAALQQITADHAVINADDGRSPEEIEQDVFAARFRVVSAMALPVDSYVQLLSTLPKLVLERSHFGGIWLEDHNHPGRPLRCLYSDVRIIGRLLPYLRNPQRTELAVAVGLAMEALKQRDQLASTEPTVRQVAQQKRQGASA